MPTVQVEKLFPGSRCQTLSHRFSFPVCLGLFLEVTNASDLRASLLSGSILDASPGDDEEEEKAALIDAKRF